MVKSYTTKNPSQTRKLGEKLAKEILMKKTKKAVVVGLIGELGGGKTTFLQGFAKGLGIKEKILSPTFVIMKNFSPSCLNSKFKHFYHIDCYRIQKPKEILGLGFKKIISDPENIIAIEWADRIKEALPKNVVMLEFDFINKNTRRITIGAKRKSKRNYRG